MQKRIFYLIWQNKMVVVVVVVVIKKGSLRAVCVEIQL